ncbi:MAG: hypothetical protein Greene041662_258 [Candidatus Peregrinibacteria bacterium Greene0416_62]|nr:MAG: hypothetical protein Greene041662_258 [Candidatus Peregrinibacteria bacterium Greene0416_62]TSC99812.1 MAG: hypothetical protein Greene101449_503 [Candidatus Peregrinibacteria bacterium Greene1014_49]
MSNSPSLWKQLAGAVIGGSLGLLVYSGYHVASPKLTAWMSIPQQWLESNGEGSRVADTDRSDRTNSHFEARAREIATEFGAAYKNYQVKEAAPEVGSAMSATSVSPVESSPGVIPFEGATEDVIDSPVGADAVSSEGSSDDWQESNRAKVVREIWNDEAIEKAPGPDTDELPDSGIGVLGALIAAGAGAGGLRARKRK